MSTSPSKPPRRPRIEYMLAAPFEAMIALAAVIASVYALLNPDPLAATAIGRSARGLLTLWEVLYAVGGMGILAGLFSQSVRVEVAGLSLFAAALLIQAFAISDFAGARGVVSFCTFMALAIACFARAYVLMRGRNRRLRSTR